MTTKNDLSVSTAPREVIITRTINAPRELVFDAFTKKEHLENWFGPHGFRVTAETEPRVGGKYHIIMHGTNALPEPFATGDYPMKGKYTEFVRPERIAYTVDLSEHPQSWKDMLMSNIPNAEKENYLSGFVTITFDDLGGTTKLAIHSRFDSDAVRDGYVKFQMVEGWELSFEKLEEYLTGTSNRTMSATRILNAPRDLVWTVLTEPEHIKNWWGPNGFSLTTHKHEMRTGGEWNYTMHGPDGTDYQNEMVFDELVPIERIVYSHGPTPKFQMFIQLFDLGDKTELRWKNVFENDEEFKQAVEVYHAIEGLHQNLGRLSEYLSKI